jgi:hypothetical protein
LVVNFNFDFVEISRRNPTGLSVPKIRRKPKMITKAVEGYRAPKAAADFDT